MWAVCCAGAPDPLAHRRLSRGCFRIDGLFVPKTPSEGKATAAHGFGVCASGGDFDKAVPGIVGVFGAHVSVDKHAHVDA